MRYEPVTMRAGLASQTWGQEARADEVPLVIPGAFLRLGLPVETLRALAFQPGTAMLTLGTTDVPLSYAQRAPFRAWLEATASAAAR